MTRLACSSAPPATRPRRIALTADQHHELSPGDAGERPEICGRSLAVRPGRECRRSEGRGLVHQGPGVRGTKVGTPDGQGYLQILSLSPSFALVLVPPSTPRSSACDRMTDDELAAIISRAKLTEQQWVPETCIS